MARRSRRGDRHKGATESPQLAEKTERTQIFEKTKMCKFHLLEMCAKGSACRFAHDPCEMNSLPDLYRTKLCKTLINTGKCKDSSCRYAHSKDEMRDIPLAEQEDELQEKSALKFPAVPTPDATATMATAQAMLETSMALTAMPTSMLQAATLQQLATDIVAQAKAQVAMLQMVQNPQEHAAQLQAMVSRVQTEGLGKGVASPDMGAQFPLWDGIAPTQGAESRKGQNVAQAQQEGFHSTSSFLEQGASIGLDVEQDLPGCWTSSLPSQASAKVSTRPADLRASAKVTPPDAGQPARISAGTLRSIRSAPGPLCAMGDETSLSSLSLASHASRSRADPVHIPPAILRSVGSVGSQLASLAEEGADAAHAGTSLGDHDYDVVVKNSFDYEPIHVTPGRLRPISTWAGCLHAADESPRQPARLQRRPITNGLGHAAPAMVQLSDPPRVQNGHVARNTSACAGAGAVASPRREKRVQDTPPSPEPVRIAPETLRSVGSASSSLCAYVEEGNDEANVGGLGLQRFVHNIQGVLESSSAGMSPAIRISQLIEAEVSGTEHVVQGFAVDGMDDEVRGSGGTMPHFAPFSEMLGTNDITVRNTFLDFEPRQQWAGLRSVHTYAGRLDSMAQEYES